MPDIQQLIVLAFALVPGFIAAETQAFVALRRSASNADKALLAIAYSAVLYLGASVGRWGPQYSPAVQALQRGEAFALTDQDLLARYILLLGLAVALGLVVGRSLGAGWLRRIVAEITGRNVLASTWVEYFHDRPRRRFWIELRDGRRIAGVVAAASDTSDEQYLVLGWPKWVAKNGQVVSMNLSTILVDGSDCVLTGELPDDSSARARVDQERDDA
jgi:hypothetical protein